MAETLLAADCPAAAAGSALTVAAHVRPAAGPAARSRWRPRPGWNAGRSCSAALVTDTNELIANYFPLLILAYSAAAYAAAATPCVALAVLWPPCWRLA